MRDCNAYSVVKPLRTSASSGNYISGANLEAVTVHLSRFSHKCKGELQQQILTYPNGLRIRRCFLYIMRDSKLLVTPDDPRPALVSVSWRRRQSGRRREG